MYFITYNTFYKQLWLFLDGSLLILLIHASHPSNDEFIKNLIPKNYSANRPQSFAPVKLDWSIIPHGVQTLSAKNMEFGVDVSIKTNWFDDQLRIPNDALYILPKEVATRLWHPFLEFTNCKGCGEILIDPDEQKFWLNNKKIWVLYRKIFHFNCLFDLTYYPFDVQQCQIDVQLIIWHGLVEFSIEQERKRYHDIDEKTFMVPSEYKLLEVDVLSKICPSEQKNSNLTCFSYLYIFQRKSMQHILLIFVPSMLIVILSWISFWLDVEMAAARVALGLTSLLTLATQFNSAQQNLPTVTVLKALDIWMFVCIFMVFASLLEYAIAFNCYRITKSRCVDDPFGPLSTVPKIFQLHEKMSFIFIKIKLKVPTSETIDWLAKILFPLAFIIFNAYFWNHYSS